MENSQDYVVVFIKGAHEEDLNGLEFTKVHKRDVKEVNREPPNGGYSWFVAVASFIICFLLTGFPKAFAGVKSAILVEFPDTKTSASSWLPGLIGTLTLIVSPVAGSLIRRFGTAWIVFAGGLLCCIGLFASGFATSTSFLVISLGVCLGVGNSLVSNAVVACIAKHFTTLKPTAIAIALSGGCAGAVVFPFAIEALLPLLGLHCFFFVLAALFSIVWILAFLFRDLGKVMSFVRSQVSIFGEAAEEEVCIQMGCDEEEEEVDEVETKVSRLGKIFWAITEEFGLEYISDREFMLTTLSAVAMALASPTFLHCITHRAANAGFSLSQTFCLTSVLVVRLTYGILAPYSPVPRAVEYAIAMVVSTVAVLVLPVCSAYGHFLAATMVAALGAGIWGMLVPLVLGSNHGAANIGKTFALVRFFQGIAKVFYPIMLNLVHRANGESATFAVNAALMVIGSVSGICLCILVWRRRRAD